MLKLSTPKASKLLVYSLVVGICCVLWARTAVAVPIDVDFGFGSTLNPSSPAVSGDNDWGNLYNAGTTTVAGVGALGWSGTSNRVSLNGTSFGSSASSGVYQNQVFGVNNGKVEFESNTSAHTFGTSALPNVGQNSGQFHSEYSSGDLGQDHTGVVGFQTSEGNWGYLEFDWTESTSTLSVLSAKAETVPNTPIVFDPGGGGGGGGQGIPVSFGFGSVLDTSSPTFSGATNWGLIYDQNTTTGAGVGNVSWVNTAANISLGGLSSAGTNGFMQNQFYQPKVGQVVYESNSSAHTFGPTLPGTGANSAYFQNTDYGGGADLGQDVAGVVGFQTSTGNWGYVEFDWDENGGADQNGALTVVSARVEPTPNTPILFDPNGGGEPPPPPVLDGIPVSFGFGSKLNTSSPAFSGATQWGVVYDENTTTNAGVGNISWNNTADNISLAGLSSGGTNGFNQNQVYQSGVGQVVYESNTSAHSFGTNLPGTGNNSAYFQNALYGGAADLGQDVTGVVGFQTSTGHWGYVEFDWDENGGGGSGELNVLSARVKEVPNVPIIFDPGGGGGIPDGGPGHADGTLDVSFGFGNVLDPNSLPSDDSTNFGEVLTTDVLGNTVAAGVGHISWTATATKISLNGSNAASPSGETVRAGGKGFQHEGNFGTSNGLVDFESNTESHTFGAGTLLGTDLNSAQFHNTQFTGGDLGQDATGVVGFRTSAGNWGYIEFDWDESASAFTVLSARVQRFANQSITFTPSGAAVGSPAVVPEPSSLLLLVVGLALMGRGRRKQLV